MAIRGSSTADTVLVSGCSGYIGTHLRKRLPFLGIDYDQSLTNIEDFDPKDSQFQNVRQVIHLADRRLQDINSGNLKSNIAMHETFLKKLASLPRLEKIIFSSSCSVYGYSEEIIDETSSVKPTSHYAESKLAVENLLKKHELPHQVFRFATAYGWSENMRDDLFVNEIANAVGSSRVLDIYAPEAWRPYIHCRDFAAVLERGLMDSTGPVVNVVTHNMTKKNILDLNVLKTSSLRYSISDKAEIRNYRVKIRQELIPSPQSMEEGIREMIGRYHDRKK